MGKLLWVGLASAALALSCTNNYDDFGFPGGASGGASSGGAAGGGSASGAGGTAGTGNVSGSGGSGNAGGTAGAGNASSAGGAGGECGPCPTGMVCNNQRCECTAPEQCGSGQAIGCNGDGRCVCDGNSCRPGETCSNNGGNPDCTCNGGQGCDSNEICCASGCSRPFSDEANCGACAHTCAAGQQCHNGYCAN